MQSTYPDSFLSDRKEELICKIEETVSRLYCYTIFWILTLVDVFVFKLKRMNGFPNSLYLLSGYFICVMLWKNKSWFDFLLNH